MLLHSLTRDLECMIGECTGSYIAFLKVRNSLYLGVLVYYLALFRHPAVTLHSLLHDQVWQRSHWKLNRRI